MLRIFDAITDKNLEEVHRIVNEDHKIVHNIEWEKTPLDYAIGYGQLKMAKFLFEEGGRPNLDAYRDGIFTPMHWAAQDGHTDTLKWIFAESVLSLDILNFKNRQKWTPFDCAITYGNLEIAQFFFEKGGRPNLDAYRDGKDTPVHYAAYEGYTTTLKWVFTEKILPPCVLRYMEKEYSLGYCH